MTEWPNGAIKTLAEIESLLEMAKKEEQTLYKVRSDALIRCTFNATSRFEAEGRRIRCINSIKLEWYSLDTKYPTKSSFLFRNYWHAWGYKNRMNNDSVEKS